MFTRRQAITSVLATGACALYAEPSGGQSPGTPRSDIEWPALVEGANYRLQHIGSMRETIMGGKRQSRLNLRTLAGQAGLLGIGPLGGLTGEVTIVDGQAFLSRVSADGDIKVEESFDGGSPFFVWANVTAWQARPIPPTVRSYDDLERFLDVAVAEAGLSKACPFKVAGQMDAVRLHVVDAKDDDPPGMEHHAKIQKHFERTALSATLVGFWSREHRGVFTHMGSNIHVHVQAADNSVSGHVEKVLLGAGLQLMLPKV